MNKKYTIPIILGLIMSGALFLRLFALMKYGIQYDEVTSFAFPDMFYSMNVYAPQPVFLYNFVMNCLLGITGNEFLLRVPSLFWGIAAFVPAYLFARRLTDRKTACIAVFLMAISPFLVCFSQEIRMYSFLFFLGCLSLLFFVTALQSGSVRAWAGNSVCNVLGAYLNFSAILIIPAQVVYLFLFRKKYGFQKKRICRVLVFQFISLIPWMYIFFRQFVFMLQQTHADKRVYSYIDTIGILNFFFTVKNFCAGFYSSDIVRDCFLVVMVGLVLVTVRIMYSRNMRETLFFLLMSFSLPMIVMIIFSQFRSIYCDKYMIVSVLPFSVLAAYAISRQKTKGIVIILFCVSVLSCLSLQRYYANKICASYRERVGVVARKELFKVADVLKTRYEKTDAVIHTSGASTLSVAYYLDSPSQRREFVKGNDFHLFLKEIYQSLGMENRLIFHNVTTSTFYFYDEPDDSLSRALAKRLSGFKRVWLIYSYWERPEPFEKVKTWFDSNCVLLESRAFAGVQVFLYKTGIPLEQ
ncbi:MAG: glycosyltransferase family 39 protein [Candidatus Omnitrophica bacterium]|nr:glycosyltransferase family 39 protein [Candidatus Omnitrophota bacterium]